MDKLDEREELFERILDHQDNTGRDGHEIHAIARKIKKLRNGALQSVLNGLNKKVYA